MATEGSTRAVRPASALHPFGYARERYVYAFLVAIILFSLGGLYAVYEGYHKIRDPHPLESPIVAVIVLVIAAVLEGYALRTAVGEANRTRGKRDWLAFIKRTRNPELPVILLEDSGALGPDELLLAAKIGVGAEDEGRDIAATIDDAEARVRAAVPSAKVIYLEPDIFRPAS
ncbi:cation transporter [Actinoplanes sp. CA-054009]